MLEIGFWDWFMMGDPHPNLVDDYWYANNRIGMVAELLGESTVRKRIDSVRGAFEKEVNSPWHWDIFLHGE